MKDILFQFIKKIGVHRPYLCLVIGGFFIGGFIFSINKIQIKSYIPISCEIDEWVEEQSILKVIDPKSDIIQKGQEVQIQLNENMPVMNGYILEKNENILFIKTLKSINFYDNNNVTLYIPDGKDFLWRIIYDK